MQKAMSVLYALDAPAEKILNFTFKTVPKFLKRYSFVALEFLYDRLKPKKKKHHIHDMPRNMKGQVQSAKPNGQRGNLNFSYYKKKKKSNTLEFEARTVTTALKDAGLSNINCVGSKIGPMVTTYGFNLSQGLPSSVLESRKLSSWQNDIAYLLKIGQRKARLVKPTNSWSSNCAFEVVIDNERSNKIDLEAVLTSKEFWAFKGSLVIALGAGPDGYFFVDLAKLPHILVGGTTGGGKSVGLNSMLLSLMHGNRPSEVKFVICDPAGTEFNVFENSKYLHGGIANGSKQSLQKLKEMVDEMNRRLKILQKNGVKNLDEYNAIAQHTEAKIVVIIDELYFLMEESKGECEAYIKQLAAVARKTGIHIIAATQRPDVEVVTGNIKANLPTRLAYRVASNTDSRVILDAKGAEDLNGAGDALFKNGTELKRTQAPFISENRLEKVVI